MNFDSIMVILVVIYFVWKSIREAKQKMGDEEQNAVPPDFLQKILNTDDPLEFFLDEKPIPPAKKHATDIKRRSTRIEKEKQGQKNCRQLAGTPVPPSAPHLSSTKPKIDRKRLREAIIWSELLGPPLALRDEQRPGPY
ncbi:MAG: hypothetical protein OEV64_00685 [Desulfobulbaceae bacterium]|nr:hypothetical protein [Desulfobulbaceae bacterium]